MSLVIDIPQQGRARSGGTAPVALKGTRDSSVMNGTLRRKAGDAARAARPTLTPYESGLVTDWVVPCLLKAWKREQARPQ